jgi:hypothetical protein
MNLAKSNNLQKRQPEQRTPSNEPAAGITPENAAFRLPAT